MAVHVPEKLLVGKIKFGTSYPSDFYGDSGSPYHGSPLSYIGTFEIVRYTAGYPDNFNNTNLYNANDIEVGWQFLLPNGKWYDIVEIVNVTDEAEEEYRKDGTIHQCQRRIGQELANEYAI